MKYRIKKEKSWFYPQRKFLFFYIKFWYLEGSGSYESFCSEAFKTQLGAVKFIYTLVGRTNDRLPLELYGNTDHRDSGKIEKLMENKRGEKKIHEFAPHKQSKPNVCKMLEDDGLFYPLDYDGSNWNKIGITISQGIDLFERQNKKQLFLRYQTEDEAKNFLLDQNNLNKKLEKYNYPSIFYFLDSVSV